MLFATNHIKTRIRVPLSWLSHGGQVWTVDRGLIINLNSPPTDVSYFELIRIPLFHFHL